MRPIFIIGVQAVLDPRPPAALFVPRKSPARRHFERTPGQGKAVAGQTPNCAHPVPSHRIKGCFVHPGEERTSGDQRRSVGVLWLLHRNFHHFFPVQDAGQSHQHF
jgi:hypothetical protein